ncbi:sensor histidine kinase [Parafrankia sp. EUN1f]|uniref:sensor histidine kinase n=1 Tax=Parafrankia sp. EUN1f TaxID=102897 RepID=UPI0001C45B5F|nr:sensor histidine kinase [Parafrankia sp. EUN1f]EFC81672.1 putative signal transduction histidine kinase [Parafrankia sp. EUN1f]
MRARYGGVADGRHPLGPEAVGRRAEPSGHLPVPRRRMPEPGIAGRSGAIRPLVPEDRLPGDRLPGDQPLASSSRAGQALERSVLWALAVLRMATCAITLIYVVLWWDWYRDKPVALGFVAFTAAWGAFLVVRIYRHGAGARLALGTVALAVVAAALSPHCLPPESVGDTGSWVTLSVLHGGLTAAWVLPRRGFAVAEAALLAAVAVGGHQGRPQVFTAVVLTLVVPVLFAFATRRLRATARRADDRLTSAMLGHRARVLVLTLDRDRRERQRVLHDTVLNTLTGLAWGGGEDLALARRRCAAGADAIRQLLAHDIGPPAVGLDAALTAAVTQARERGLVVHLQGIAPLTDPPATVAAGGTATAAGDMATAASGTATAAGDAVNAAGDTVTGDPPAAVVAALTGATGEALANVERHAGTGEAWVRLERASGQLTVRVHDHGGGFQPGRSAPDRLGVCQSVLARVRDAGGLASVDSAPGRGTVVTMRWPEIARPPTERTPADRADRDRADRDRADRDRAGGDRAGRGGADRDRADRGTRTGTDLAREETAEDLRRDYAAGLRVVVAGVALAWHTLMVVPLLVTLGRVRSPLAAVGVWCALGAGTFLLAAVVRRRPLSAADAAGVTMLTVGAALTSVNVDNAELLRITNWPIIVVALLLAFVTASRPPVQAVAAAGVGLAAIVVTVIVRQATDPLTVSRLLALVYGIVGLQLLVAIIGSLLRRTADTTARATRAEAETHAGQDSDAMIRRERARWLGAIRDDVLPMLDTLAAGDADPRDPGWRWLCARQAAGIRRKLAQEDQSATLASLAADIEAVVAAAEGRGLTVEVQIATEAGRVGFPVPLDLRAGLVDLLDRTLAMLPENRALLTMWSDAGGGSVFVSAAWPGDRAPPTLTGDVAALVDVDDGRLTVELRWENRED